ncbi:MAG: DNRLRE domain-containing protein [Gammaproteobacteria bacterium]
MIAAARRGHHSATVARTLLKFDLAPLGTGAKITAARLELSAAGYTSNPLVVELHHLADDAWYEDTVTWNEPPSLVGASMLAARDWSPAEAVNWTSRTLPLRSRGSDTCG